MSRKRFDIAPEIRIGSHSLLLAVQSGSSSNILEIKDSSNNTIFTIDNNGSIPNLAVNGSSLVFEGATADSYELTLQATDPTADRTITLPDATTTIVGTDTSDTLTNKTISSGTLTGTLTVGGSVGTNGQVLQSTGSGIQWATAAGSGTVTSITAGTGLSGGTITTSGTISIDSTVVTLSGSQTLTNKTITTPTLTLASVVSPPTSAGAIAWITGDNKLSIGDGTVSKDFVSSTIVTNSQSSSYTLVLSDKDKLVEMNVGSANNLTVPPNSSVAYPVGTQINILQVGSGQTTIVAGSGVTVNATPGLKLRAQWSSVTLIKRDTNIWVALGDLQA